MAFFLTRGEEHRPTALGLAPPHLTLLRQAHAVYAKELEPVKRAALSARGVAVDKAVLGAERVCRARYARDMEQGRGAHSLLAYVSWRGQVAAALMLGRTGRGFTRSDIEKIECLLPTIAVARAAYGYACPAQPRNALVPIKDSDHVLNIAYNLLCGGHVLEDKHHIITIRRGK